MVFIRRDEGFWRKYVTVARAGLIACAALLVSAASSGAQQIAAKNNQNPNKNNQTSNLLPPSAAKPIIVIVQPSAQEVEAIAAQEAAKSRTIGFPPDAWVAFFTAVLSVSTTLLWRSTDKSAKAAARAAEIAERALVELERPFVYCRITKPGIEIRPIPTTVDGNTIGVARVISRKQLEITTANFGRTPAQLTRFFWKVDFSVHGGICDPINPQSEGGRELPIGTVCANDAPFLETGTIDNLGRKEDDAILNNQKAIWITGFVRYDDIFGSHYINGFAFVYDADGRRFIRRGGQSYNYQRSEKASEVPLPSSLN